MFRILIPLVCATLACAADAWSPVTGFSVQPDGRIQVGGQTLILQHYDGDWKVTTSEKALTGTGAVAGAGWNLAGEWKTATTSARLSQAITVVDGQVHVDARLADAGPTKMFCLAVVLAGKAYRGKELRIDGTALALPAESPQPILRNAAPAKLLEIPLAAGGTIEINGAISVYVQDNRKWGTDSFAVRVIAGKGEQLVANLRLKP